MNQTALENSACAHSMQSQVKYLLRCAVIVTIPGNPVRATGDHHE